MQLILCEKRFAETSTKDNLKWEQTRKTADSYTVDVRTMLVAAIDNARSAGDSQTQSSLAVDAGGIFATVLCAMDFPCPYPYGLATVRGGVPVF